MQDCLSASRSLIQDRTLYEDGEIFAPTLRDLGMLTERDYQNYRALYETLLSTVRPPDMILLLTAPTEVLLERIRRRDRAFERHVDAAYLERLERRYEDWAGRISEKVPVRRIDTSRLDLEGRGGRAGPPRRGSRRLVAGDPPMTAATPARRTLIGIAGGTASGKTLVANRIFEALGGRQVAILKQDHYYKDIGHLPFEERIKTNFDHPDAFDNELLREHVRTMLRGESIEQPIYDFTNHLRLPDTVTIGPHPIYVLEGILILADDELRAMMDIKVYVDTDTDVRLIRRIRRDVAERGTDPGVGPRSVRSLRPADASAVRRTIEALRRYHRARGGHNRVAIDLLGTKIPSVLAERWPIEAEGR